MARNWTNKSFIETLSSLPLRQQRMIGARFIKNILDLTNDKNLISAQSIAASGNATAEDLLEAYHSAHTSYVKTNPRSGQVLLDWKKQAEHFVAEACLTCLAPTYQEASPYHLAQRVAMYCRIARTCASVNHEGEYPSFENLEEASKKEVGDQYRIVSEFLDSQ